MIVSALLATLLVTAAPADTAPVLTVPEVMISGDRVAPAAVRMPTAAVSERSMLHAAAAQLTLAEVLGSIAGVHVSEYGGLGAFSTVSMRGLPSSHVALMVDGVPLGTAGGSSIDLGSLPVAAIERIETYRGSSPLMLGVSAPAGAVNLVTLAAPRFQELRLERGSFDTWEGRCSFGARRGPFAAQMFASSFSTRGDFIYHDRNGTDLDPSDDGDSVRFNNRRDVFTGLAALSWLPGGGWRASARQIYLHRALGLPGVGAVPALNARFVEAWSHSQLELARAARAWLPQLRVVGAAEEQHLNFRDTEGRLAIGRHDTRDALRGESVALAVERPEHPRWLVVQGQASLRRDRADLSDALAGLPAQPESRRWTRGATADVELRPFGERLLLHAARRWERLEDHLRVAGVGTSARRTDVARELVTPQVGARLALWRGLAARANWSEAARAPEFRELFGNEGTIAGNAALTPESVRNRDAGLSWRAAPWGRALNLEGWLFATNADDLILLVRNSQSTLKAQNISRMDNRGAELTTSVALPFGFAANGAGTWQRARDRGNVKAWRDRKIPMRPDRELHVELSWRGRWLGAEGALHDIDANYVDRYNSLQYLVPRRRLVSAALRLTPPRTPLSVSFDLKNLTNDHASDIAGTPLPGRAVFVTLDWRLGPSGSAPPTGEQP